VLDAHEREHLARLARAERLVHVGQIAAGVAHELRNPLSVIETSVFLLQEGVPPTTTRATRQIERIRAQVGIASDIVGDLLDAARNRPAEMLPVDLADIAREAVTWVPRPADTVVEASLPVGVAVVSGDARRLRQVLINLVSNALQAMRAVSPPRLTLSLAVADGFAAVTVRDHGPGIAPEHLARLFEPLWSTRADGVGLGLALSRELAAAHGGTLRADNAPDGGAAFTLRLPLPPAPSAAQTPR
jgi:two-component system NtrC family sensor kinase